jgi:hypothetical protein
MMSVGRVIKTGDQEYSLVDFRKHGLGLADLAEFIRLGHEIDVHDEHGQNLTKETLVDVAFAASGLPESESARAKLMREDDFRLQQIIEDDQVTEFLSR